MTSEETARSDWTPDEVDLIVADHFEMLGREIAGKSYVKAHRNEALQKLIGRSGGAIEFKHCNISAVLELLGLPTINGYKPRRNFQKSLIDGVERFLDGPTFADFTPTSAETSGVREQRKLWVGEPPSLATHEGATPEPMRRILRKFDPAARDARNRKLGHAGERLVFDHERSKLIAQDKGDLAKKVRWVSEEEGDGAGFDIQSFTPEGKERLIEVKTTNGRQRTPFFLSENERSFSDERPEAFYLLRLFNFAKAPAAYELRPPLSEFVRLDTVSYRATPV